MFVSTIKMALLWILVAIAVHKQLILRYFNIRMAFLNNELNKEVYVK